MTTVLIVVVLAALAAGSAFLLLQRRTSTRDEDGVAGFRRHMDALSSEARRDVIDRVRDAKRDAEED
jgi:hypothetical protein